MSAVHVCTEQDRECGERVAGWCIVCPKLKARSQAQQITYALGALQRIAAGEPAPAEFAAIAIKHITCGQVFPAQQVGS